MSEAISGGASTVRQALIAGVIDELTLDITPTLLGAGERMFEPVEVLHSPLATHIRYRRVDVGRGAGTP
jgi:dihydrofolate reductase